MLEDISSVARLFVETGELRPSAKRRVFIDAEIEFTISFIRIREEYIQRTLSWGPPFSMSRLGDGVFPICTRMEQCWRNFLMIWASLDTCFCSHLKPPSYWTITEWTKTKISLNTINILFFWPIIIQYNVSKNNKFEK